ncbi:S-adenosyl-L-methionine-dependent methyltransferase [Lecanosticta acicola]|uniref:S-adenosyl-L-methionine-dependent methyltransferase n=1 Tax=Lecanosticta acicola TaxID=111012 RepID=A0AAI8YPI4_9PEZI|nr:S-adenosyl-L-methionine-dependent methyltransferase [Lecanosticta acicola]
MSEDVKKTIGDTYDNIAAWYLAWVEGQASPRVRYTRRLLDQCPVSPNLLELGCGAGVPVLRMLMDHGATVTGNDISTKQIELAQSRFPQAALIAGDMTALILEENSLDGILAFFSLFHLPREEYRSFLSKLFAWLKPSGVFAFNLATVDQDEIHGEFFGHGMFWSSFGETENLTVLADAGFTILEEEVLEAGDGKLEEGDPDYGVKFMWILAMKPERAG